MRTKYLLSLAGVLEDTPTGCGGGQSRSIWLKNVADDLLTWDCMRRREMQLKTDLKYAVVNVDTGLGSFPVRQNDEHGYPVLIHPVRKTRSLAIAKRPCECYIILKSGSYTKAI